jgi:hypothetical protein
MNIDSLHIEIMKHLKNGRKSFKKIADETCLFFSWLYQQSHYDDKKQTSLFLGHMKSLGINQPKFISVDSLRSIKSLSRSLHQLSKLKPLLKKQLMQTCIDISKMDGEITQQEYELIRLLGEYFEIPLPLLVE